MLKLNPLLIKLPNIEKDIELEQIILTVYKELFSQSTKMVQKYYIILSIEHQHLKHTIILLDYYLDLNLKLISNLEAYFLFQE